MAIKIEQISVKNCGPIAEFNEKLTNLNLIYSENERGKSFLVEFIIHCLFKNKSYWNDLREVGQGKIIVTGLENSPVEFLPTKKKKLEDFLEKQQKGLPPIITNLLIVKEGETEIVKNSLGIDKNLFKEILSPRKILESIDKKISITIKEAKIENTEIAIAKRGEGKDYYELKDKMSKIERLINQVVNEYEQGEIKDLEFKKITMQARKELLLKAKKHKAYKLSLELNKLNNQLNEIPESIVRKLKSLLEEYKKIKTQIENFDSDLIDLGKQTVKLPELLYKREILLKAKKYEAYTTEKKIKNIEEELSKIPDEELNKIEINIAKYHNKKLEKEEKNRQFQELKEKSKDYIWLKTARENYMRFISSPLKLNKPLSFFPYIGVILIIVGIISILIDQKLPGIIFIFLSVLFYGYYLIQFKKSFTNYKQSKELEIIKNEFLKRFAVELENLAHLESLLNEKEKYFYNAETYEQEIKRLETELLVIKENIDESLKRLGISSISEYQWKEILMNLKKQRNSLIEEYQKLKERLKDLEVDYKEYEINESEIKFNKKEFEEIEKEIAKIEKLKEQELLKIEEKEKLQKNLNSTGQNIKEILKELLKIEIGENDWDLKIEEIEEERNKLKEKINKIEGEIKGLGVSERDFEIEDPQKDFDPEELEIIEKKLAEVEEKIQKRNQELNNLKSQIISLTGIDPTTSWNEAIEQLYLKKEEIKKDLVDIEAKIISGIIIHDTIQELQKQEDEKLMERLNSEDIIKFINKLTGRYKALTFDERDIVIADDFGSFNIKDLSTGAKEQVMIGLRIGFAKSILKQDCAFLIFDDAFQHSDYKKRPLLIDTLIELVQEGWQVIYLTMDDHIRDLFRQKGSKLLKNFKEFSLN